jgi:VanZ family protein
LATTFAAQFSIITTTQEYCSARMSTKPAKLISVAALGFLVFAALGPGKWVPRSGLGWQIDHVAGYLVFTWIFCLAWPRPLMVGGALMALAVLLEGLQAFTPDRHPDLDAALYGAGAVLAAALVAGGFMRAPRLLTRPTLFVLKPFRLLRPAWNNARAALLTASGRARLLGSALARCVAPPSPTSVGLIAQPIAVRLRTDSSFREHIVSSRSADALVN